MRCAAARIEKDAAEGSRWRQRLEDVEDERKQAGEEKQTDLVAIVKSQSWHV